MMEAKNIHRFTKLDGLRGLLSIIVALNHSFLILAIPNYANVWGQNILQFTNLQSKIQQIFMLLGNGGVAVTMFFILSGLVMGQSLQRVAPSIRGYVGFIFKRMTRLYPAYFFLIVFSAIYMRLGFIYKIYPGASSWFQWWMNFDMTLKEFILNAFFISISLGGITWTLRVIVIASLIFPVFYLLTKNTSKFLDTMIFFGLLIASFTILNIPGFRDLRYLYMFFSGLMIPKFASFFERVPSWFVYLVLPAFLFILTDFRYLTDEYIGGVGECVAGWFLIGVMAYNTKLRLFNFLDTKLFIFLGRISYSLYLVHFTVLYIVSKIMFDYLPYQSLLDSYLYVHLLLFVVSTMLAVQLSVLVNKYVEGPSIKLAHAISSKFS